MLAKVRSCSVIGIDGLLVEVEADISNGLPAFYLVGLPEASVKESRDRVRTAVKNSGYAFPMERVVVNLAPADVRKEGGGFDLPIALAVLTASNKIPAQEILNYLVVGELSLDGSLKPVKGALSYALLARDSGHKGIIVPSGNADEAAMVSGVDVIPARHLSELVDFFAGFSSLAPHQADSEFTRNHHDDTDQIDWSDVKGQFSVKRALEISAAGNHSVLMTGPPGSGKSMIARRLKTILPDLVFDEAIDVTRIYSVAGMMRENGPFLSGRPFRAPHHTISDAGLVGGGTRPMPGEISLAHNGVLFLDELPEFKKRVLEMLRQPMEDGVVSIARAGAKVVYPSKFMLVAAMNPCPCGFFTDPGGRCTCTHTQVNAYQSRISGPLLDRLDIQVEVPKVPYSDLIGNEHTECSADVRRRVGLAREIQENRFLKSGIFNNAAMGSRHIDAFCKLDADGHGLLKQAADQLGFSARACHSILKVARTIADLDHSQQIRSVHLSEAVQYRSFDRQA